MRSQRFRFAAFLRWPLTALLACFVMSCASLPDVHYLNERMLPAEQPSVDGAHGPLPPEKAQALLERRLRSADVNAERLAGLEEAATGRPLIAGNKVDLLFDGPQTLAAMRQAIEGATDSINLETYIFDADEVGRQFADLLIAKQRAGVQVNVIVDAVGTLGTPAAFFDRMRQAGIALLEFHPVNPLKRFGLWRINNRDHRKILVVDGRIGFTGGINITSDYSKSSLFHSGSRARREETERSGVGWRDTHIRVEGPAVAAMQWLFVKNWTGQTDRPLAHRDYFPQLSVAGNKVVRVLGSEPGGDFEVYKAYILAIREAKKSIHITTPYFSPDAQMVDALRAAAARGVDVQIIFPSVTDSKIVFYSGRSYYTTLLESGIHIHELQVAVLHAKTAVIDGFWSTVGSANLDIRSFLHNSEINVIVLDQAFAREMEKAFDEDLRDTRPVTLDQWQKRPFSERLKEWAARRFDYWL
ncbi:MAG: cardiolipin synthase [Burkholderiaceae bacterium]